MKEIGGVEFPDVLAKLSAAEEKMADAPVVDTEAAKPAGETPSDEDNAEK